VPRLIRDIAEGLAAIGLVVLVFSPILYAVWRARGELYRITSRQALARVIAWSGMVGFLVAVGILFAADGINPRSVETVLIFVLAVAVWTSVLVVVARRAGSARGRKESEQEEGRP
jgi:hypothetical protein